ncbi:hypothetical protein ACJRO7_001673 [Eucalyptus globulus]|uniref:Uncharacterized protein n=1 Tax=Eucalyptus globulus TaxID=34317 RepID=A0ABD3LRS1_EUCGL
MADALESQTYFGEVVAQRTKTPPWLSPHEAKARSPPPNFDFARYSVEASHMILELPEKEGATATADAQERESMRGGEGVVCGGSFAGRAGAGACLNRRQVALCSKATGTTFGS